MQVVLLPQDKNGHPTADDAVFGCLLGFQYEITGGTKIVKDDLANASDYYSVLENTESNNI